MYRFRKIVPYRINPKKSMPRYIIIDYLKTKDRGQILKAAREKQCITYRKGENHLDC